MLSPCSASERAEAGRKGELTPIGSSVRRAWKQRLQFRRAFAARREGKSEPPFSSPLDKGKRKALLSVRLPSCPCSAPSAKISDSANGGQVSGSPCDAVVHQTDFKLILPDTEYTADVAVATVHVLQRRPRPRQALLQTTGRRTVNFIPGCKAVFNFSGRYRGEPIPGGRGSLPRLMADHKKGAPEGAPTFQSSRF